MTTEQAIAKLNEYEAAAYALRYTTSVLFLDGATAAPKASYTGRGKAVGYLSELSYKQTVNEEIVETLETLMGDKEHLDEITYRRAEVLKERYDNMHVMPMEEYTAYEELVNEASAVWHEAKEKSDYAMFAPYLEKMIAYQRRYAERKDSSRKPYDVLLDEYENGLNTETLDRFFATIREELTPVVRELESRPKEEFPFLNAVYPLEDQRRFTARLMAMEGLPAERCTVAETEHPFTDGLNKWDVRITTHYREDAVFSNMFSVFHEGGHALYELGVADELQFTCVAGGSTMGIHESQSRLYENLICRSLPFCKALLPVMNEVFPEQMKGVTLEQLYRGINKSQPSLIRTEADELTYPLHVMIRYEIEKKMMAGEVTVKELPELWNAMYKEYLGVIVPDDKHGILQDSHWSTGLFGYFPSYALGSAYGVQMLKRMEAERDIWSAVEKGDLSPVTEWLGEKIHRFGCLKKPGELLLNAMGEPLDPKVYTNYLKEKYLNM